MDWKISDLLYKSKTIIIIIIIYHTLNIFIEIPSFYSSHMSSENNQNQTILGKKEFTEEFEFSPNSSPKKG